MPKAGHYEYPVRDLDSCLEYLKRAHDQTQNLSIKRDTFADALRLSPKTGPFGILVGSLAHYGLVETGDGYIRYTDIAKKALWGEPNEKMNAKQQAIRSVTLFDDIYKKYPNGASDDQLRLFLRESAGVDVTDAPSIAVDLSKIFKKVVHYLDNTNAAKSDGGGETKRVDENLGRITTPDLSEDTATFSSSDDFGIWIKKDPSSIDFAKQQIDSWLDYMKKKCEGGRQIPA